MRLVGVDKRPRSVSSAPPRAPRANSRSPVSKLVAPSVIQERSASVPPLRIDYARSLENALAEEDELREIEEKAAIFVKESKQQSWDKYLRPMKEMVQEAVDLLKEVAHLDPVVESWLFISRSLVAFGPKQRSIGESAKTQETSNYRNTVGSLKRLVGRTLNDPEIQEVEKRFINATLVDFAGTVGVEVGVVSSLLEVKRVADLPLIGQLPW